MRLPPELFDRITERAKVREMSRNEYIIKVLSRHIERGEATV